MTVVQTIKVGVVLWFETSWIKKYLTDGWLTNGHQVACLPNHVRAFALCEKCRSVFPLWLATMTAAEAKSRGFLGCKCGGMKLSPAIIPTWQSIWWFCIRGWLVRHVVLRKRIWDPRIVVMVEDID